VEWIGSVWRCSVAQNGLGFVKASYRQRCFSEAELERITACHHRDTLDTAETQRVRTWRCIARYRVSLIESVPSAIVIPACNCIFCFCWNDMNFLKLVVRQRSATLEILFDLGGVLVE
jgi:hypothetical protein